jgi:hypothetical protein
MRARQRLVGVGLGATLVLHGLGKMLLTIKTLAERTNEGRG